MVDWHFAPFGTHRLRAGGMDVIPAFLLWMIKDCLFLLGYISGNQCFKKPLNAAEEKALLLRLKEGDEEARQLLIEHNMRLIVHIARKYKVPGCTFDDLISIGTIGLIKAVDTFRYEVGARFATYGAKCVQNEILMFFRSRKKHQSDVSINDTIDIDKDGNPLTYLDIISTDESVERELDLKIHTENLNKYITAVLTERERDIVILRYGLMGYKPLAQREVAEHLGISRSYVSRIEKKALAELRACFGKRSVEFEN